MPTVPASVSTSPSSPGASTGSASRIGPPAGLVIPNPKATGLALPANTPDSIFALQTTAWVSLQAAVASGLKLPVSSSVFVADYGTFADQAQIDNALAVFQQLNADCTIFGDPQSLFTQFTQYTNATQPPSTIYGHAVWLAQQLATNAQTISSYYNTGVPLAANSPNWQALVADLFGPQCVLANARVMLKLCQDFEAALQTFSTAMSGSLSALNTYLAQSANVLALAQTNLTNDTTSLTAAQASLHKLNQEYIGFTVAACMAPVLTFMPPLWLLGGLIDATVFGALAATTKTQITNLQSEISTLRADKQQALALVSVITTFNLAAQNIDGDTAGFLGAISKMIGGLGALCAELANIPTQLDQFSDFNDFIQQLRMSAAINDWNAVSTYANQWVQQGFVTFNTQSLTT